MRLIHCRQGLVPSRHQEISLTSLRFHSSANGAVRVPPTKPQAVLVIGPSGISETMGCVQAGVEA